MKLKIRHKLFFTILLTSTIVAAGLFFYLQWSFDRGFLNYVKTQEITILNRLSKQLVSYYEEQNGWQFISNNHLLWQHLQQDLLPPFPGPPPHQDFGMPRPSPDNAGHPPPFPGRPERPLSIGPRIVLYDADKQKIIGGGPPGKDLPIPPLIYPVTSQAGKEIGYLGLYPVTEISETGDLIFMKDQTENFAIVTLTMVVLSMILTFPVTVHLLRPIKELTQGTRELIGGKFTTRIPVTTGDELGQLSSDFNILATTLAKNEQARRRWVADISHELRTPLSVLRGEVEAILDGVRKPNLESLEPLHGEVLHLERLVNDLYELSMSDIGALTYKKIEVNPAGILEEAVEVFEKRFEGKGLVLSSKISKDFSPTLLADPDRLHQLFSNLLENSLRYTNAPGESEVSIDYEDGHINIYFEDSEPGVKPKELEKLFERLYRVDPSRNRSTKGAGLGLTICSNIAEAHQGTITASNSSLGGLTFHIRLPHII